MTWGYEQPQSDLDQLANAATPVPEYYAPVRSPRPVPSYAGIKVGSGLLAIVGSLLILVGAVALIMAVMMTYSPPQNARMLPATIGFASVAVVQGFAGASFISYGVLLIFISSIGSAIRDIARNSFR